MKRLKLYFCGFAFLISLGCADVGVQFQPGFSSSPVSSDEICADAPKSIKNYRNILLVVDKTGSNRRKDETDRDGTKRFNGAKKLLSKFSNKSQKTRWGLITFSKGRAQNHVVDLDGNPSFTSSPTKFLKALNVIKDKKDDGLTNYEAALDTAAHVIRMDASTKKKHNHTYLVLFITDGFPSKEFKNSEKELRELVKKLRKKTPHNSKIYLSTAFYTKTKQLIKPITIGAPEENSLAKKCFGGIACVNFGVVESPDVQRERRKKEKIARKILSAMAKEGEGKFVRFDSSPKWELEDMLKKVNNSWSGDNFFVYNLNAGYCLDGSIGTDSDIDGLCDEDEENLSTPEKPFDPANRFSFGDGYGDYFHLLELEGRISLPTCNERIDIDRDFLTNCEERILKNGTGKFTFGSLPDHPDTDRDGIIDGIETFALDLRESLTHALDSANLSKMIHGMSIRETLFKHLPFVETKPLETAYDLKVESSLNHKNTLCYTLTQDTLPTYPTLAVPTGKTLAGFHHKEGENIILVSFFQKKHDKHLPEIWKYSFQNLLHRSVHSKLDLKNSSFREYRIPLEVVHDE